jgi:hypothetical protein
VLVCGPAGRHGAFVDLPDSKVPKFVSVVQFVRLLDTWSRQSSFASPWN